MQRLNLVIIGATGFVGSALMRRLSQEPLRFGEIRLLTRKTIRFEEISNAKVVVGALPDKIPSELFPNSPYVVIHFGTKQIDQDGSGFTRENVDGTEALCRSMNSFALGLIYGSSLSVQGQGTQKGVSEHEEIRPETDLAQSRADAEAKITQAAQSRKISAYLLRPRFVVGQGDRFTLPGWTRFAQGGLRLGSGEQKYSVIDVDDYAAIILDLAERIERNQSQGAPEVAPLNIGYSQPVSLNAVLKKLEPAPRSSRKAVPILPGLLRVLRKIPIAGIQKTVVRLELMGLSHFGDTQRLAERLSPAARPILDRDPLTVIVSTRGDSPC